MAKSCAKSEWVQVGTVPIIFEEFTDPRPAVDQGTTNVRLAGFLMLVHVYDGWGLVYGLRAAQVFLSICM